jgi:hypothetical protein
VGDVAGPFGAGVLLPFPGLEAGPLSLPGTEPDPGVTEAGEAGAALGMPSGAKTLCAMFCTEGGRTAA